MTLVDSQVDENEIKRYLFAELDPADRDTFEERMFVSDELFFEVVEVENRLVDDYVRGALPAKERDRFERSIESMPGRREKVANARAIREYIDAERPSPVTEPEKRSIWHQIASLFGDRSPSLGYAMAAAVVILALSTGFLVIQNRQKNTELARLRSREDRQAELERDLDTSRQREGELQTAIDNERDASGDLADELDRERQRREAAERELQKIGNGQSAPSTPVIASIMLLPTGGRGGTGGSARDVKISPETKRLSMRLSLPDDVMPDDRLTVRLNQKIAAKDVAPRISGGAKSINVSVPMQSLLKGKNELDVLDADGRAVSNYGFNVVNK